ncbi:concanavalin A-like lectin/glucanase domain-containing protein, partial [Lasiosphaeria miniovina]
TAALAATLVSGQTFTACNPTKETCPNPKAVGGKVIDIDFRKGENAFLENLAGTKVTYDKDNGAIFTINKDSDAPTMSSGDKYIFFGRIDVKVRAAPGAGIVTSFVLQSDDLDEIDWEWVGSDTAQAQTNYFSKGCTTVYDRGGFSPIANPQSNFNTYSIDWTPTRLNWEINGVVVRTLNAANANGCSGYPQTPMQIKLGTWVGGLKTAAPGTIEWAGGLANFANAPFVGAYETIRIQDYMGGDGVTGPKDASEYQYTDKSGTWQSIKVSSTTAPATTSTKGTTSSSSTHSTLTTVTSSSPVSSSVSTSSTDTTVSNSNTLSGAQTTGAAKNGASAPPSAAGKVALTLGNAAVMGAAILVGVLAL